MDVAEIAWKHFLNQGKAVYVRFRSSKDEHFYHKMDANSVDVQVAIELIRLKIKEMMRNQKIKMMAIQIQEDIRSMTFNKIISMLVRKKYWV